MNNIIVVLVGVTFVALIWYRLSVTLQQTSPSQGTKDGANGGRVKVWPFRQTMMAFILVAVLGTALYIILSKDYDDGAQKWAFGVIGSIIGFWFRPEKETG